MAFPFAAVAMMLSQMNPAPALKESSVPPVDSSTRVQSGRKPSWLEMGTKMASPKLGMQFGGGSNIFSLLSQLAGKGRE